MNKTVIAVASLFAVTFLIAFYIWSSHNRFYIMTGAQGIAYEVDRKTGESWMLFRGNKFLQHEEQKEEELPITEVGKITGNARLSYGSFSGRLYNGSDWVVTRVVVGVSAKEEDGTIRWSRDFSESISMAPLTTASFSITVTGEEGIKNAPWNLKKAFGHKK